MGWRRPLPALFALDGALDTLADALRPDDGGLLASGPSPAALPALLALAHLLQAQAAGTTPA